MSLRGTSFLACHCEEVDTTDVAISKRDSIALLGMTILVCHFMVFNRFNVFKNPGWFGNLSSPLVTSQYISLRR
jgi:hypothetical protein